MEINFAEAKLHPDELFVSPETVLQNPTFSKKQKFAILIAWKNQLELKTEAVNEGMLGRKNHDETRLMTINNLLTRLGCNSTV